MGASFDCVRRLFCEFIIGAKRTPLWMLFGVGVGCLWVELLYDKHPSSHDKHPERSAFRCAESKEADVDELG